MYTPFADDPNPLKLGFRPIPADAWLETTAFAAELAALKQTLLKSERGTVLRHAKAATHGCDELLTLVQSATGRAGDPEEKDPIARAGLLVEEDLCLMEAAENGMWRFMHGFVCLPTRWRLADKIGDTMEGVHDPVPMLNDRLANPINRFFDRLRPDRLYERFNWSLVSDPAWALEPRDRSITVPAEEREWMRVERQTFRKLPGSGAVVFTIGIHRYRIAAFDQSATAALRRAVDMMEPALARYKGFI